VFAHPGGKVAAGTGQTITSRTTTVASTATLSDAQILERLRRAIDPTLLRQVTLPQGGATVRSTPAQTNQQRDQCINGVITIALNRHKSGVDPDDVVADALAGVRGCSIMLGG
jgi:hypothetical protein